MSYIQKPSKKRKEAFMSAVQIFGTLKKFKLIVKTDIFSGTIHSITGIRKYTEAYHHEYQGRVFPTHMRLVAHHMVRLLRTLRKVMLYNTWPSHGQFKFMSKFYKRWP